MDASRQRPELIGQELMPYLARIFDGLSRLAGDVVPDVRHAAQVLDRLLMLGGEKGSTGGLSQAGWALGVRWM